MKINELSVGQEFNFVSSTNLQKQQTYKVVNKSSFWIQYESSKAFFEVGYNQKKFYAEVTAI